MTTLFITGDETGLLKAVDYTQGLSYSFGEQSRERSIIGLSASADQQSVNVLRTNGQLESWKYDLENDVNFLISSSTNLNLNAPLDLVNVYDSNLVANKLLAYTNDGSLAIFNNNGEFDDLENNESYQSLSVQGPLSACASCVNGGFIFGGKENDIKLYDINSQQIHWEARNVPHDKLKLRVPVWVTALDFLAPRDSHSFDSSKFISGTAYKHVRIYDTKADRRPIKSLDIEGDYRMTVVKSSADGNGFYVADTAGNLYYYDIRTYRRLNNLKCFQGSVRSLVVTQPKVNSAATVVAGVGLDRCLRVYETKKNKLIHKIYLKNRLNRVIALNGLDMKRPEKETKKSRFDESSEEGSEEEEEEEVGSDYDFDEDNDVLKNIEFDSDTDLKADEEVSDEEEEEEEQEESEESEEEEEEEDPKNRKKQQRKRRKIA